MKRKWLLKALSLALVSVIAVQYSAKDVSAEELSKKTVTTNGGYEEPYVYYDFKENIIDKSGNSTLEILSKNDNPGNTTFSYGKDDNGNYLTWHSDRPRGGGFDIRLNKDIGEEYTIGLKFSFEQTGPSWKKIIDYKNLSSDTGFYFYNGGHLNFYHYGVNGNSVTNNNQVVNLIVQRTKEDKHFRAYVVGEDNKPILDLDVIDSNGDGVPYAENGCTKLGFFYDDKATSSEATSGGKVYAIKIWNKYKDVNDVIEELKKIQPIKVYYKDELGNDLAEPVKLTGKEGEKANPEVKEFSRYELKKVIPEGDVFFNENDQTITFVYAKKTINIDTDEDGIPDINIDVDGDKVPDINIDTDGDDKPDINIDTDGDKKPDINIDTDGDKVPDINIDTDGDKKPDINIDTDGDKVPDINIDTDGDKKPDINIDTDGDKKPDINIDTNGDKVPDINIDTDGDKKPDINIDTDGDKKPDINIDTDGDKVPDINIDTDGDKKPDINIDTNGDKKPDINIDTDGDKKPDINIDTDGDKKPDINIDTDGDKKPDINIDTNGDKKPDINIDVDGDKKPDINIDMNGDKKPDINIDVDGDKKPDISIDTDGDGKPDINIDMDGDKKPDINIDTDNSGKWNPSNSGGNADGIWKPDTNIDTDGDGKGDKDYHSDPIDKNKDGVDDHWKPDTDVNIGGFEYGTADPSAIFNLPQTGDNSHTGMWLVLNAVSLFGISAVLLSRRKKAGSK